MLLTFTAHVWFRCMLTRPHPPRDAIKIMLAELTRKIDMADARPLKLLLCRPPRPI